MEWGRWFRENSDKFILLIIMCGLLMYVLHLIHDKVETAQIQHINGLTSTAFGSLMTLLTQKLKATATATSKEDPKTGATVGTIEVKGDSK